MLSAARLKEVMRLFESMVKTPSLMLSMMVQQGDRSTDVRLQPAGSALIRSADLFCLFVDMRRISGWRQGKFSGFSHREGFSDAKT
jgi:hypothetical protein